MGMRHLLFVRRSFLQTTSSSVLLFDEADVLLAKKKKEDIRVQSNALVSVLLRHSEYYPDILTTVLLAPLKFVGIR